MNRKSRMHALGTIFATASIVAACGGDGGGSSSPPPPPTPAGITLNGTAAVGAAIASGSVSVQCAGGSNTATTAANGSYSVTVNAGTSPCLVRVTSGGTTLYSMVGAASASPVTINLTPLTTLMTTQVLGGDPAAAFSAFNETAQARLSAANIASARTDLTAALNGRVDIAGIDPIGTAFAVGDAVDQRLDQLATVLSAANTTIAQLGTALLANPGSADPVRNLVAPGAATCAALKSGEYWGVEPMNPEFSIDNGPPVLIDAVALKATYDRGLSTQIEVTMTPVAGEPCRFTIPDDTQIDGVEELVVSSSGILASRFPEDGTFKGTIGFPRTTLTTAELAGSYNYVGYVQNGVEFGPINGTLTIAADGTLSNNQNFINLTNDTQPGDSTPRRLVQRTDGTYNDRDLTNNSLSPSRWIPHKTPDGVVTIFIAGPDAGAKGVVVMRRQAPANASAQAVGTATPFWDMTYTANGAGALAAESVTITSIDAVVTPNTVTRIRASDNRVDTRAFNSPRTGLLYRAPNSCTTGLGGPTRACAEAIFLPAQGTGFTVSSGGVPGNGSFSVSVLRP